VVLDKAHLPEVGADTPPLFDTVTTSETRLGESATIGHALGGARAC
jgi:hypothetical protein